MKPTMKKIDDDHYERIFKWGDLKREGVMGVFGRWYQFGQLFNEELMSDSEIVVKLEKEPDNGFALVTSVEIRINSQHLILQPAETALWDELTGYWQYSNKKITLEEILEKEKSDVLTEEAAPLETLKNVTFKNIEEKEFRRNLKRALVHALEETKEDVVVEKQDNKDIVFGFSSKEELNKFLYDCGRFSLDLDTVNSIYSDPVGLNRLILKAPRIAMISQPMNGLTKKEIVSKRNEAIVKLRSIGYQVRDTYFEKEFDQPEKLTDVGIIQVPVAFLSESIREMSKCTAVYFVKGWENARGCCIEREIAKQYGLEIIDAE